MLICDEPYSTSIASHSTSMAPKSFGMHNQYRYTTAMHDVILFACNRASFYTVCYEKNHITKADLRSFLVGNVKSGIVLLKLLLNATLRIFQSQYTFTLNYWPFLGTPKYCVMFIHTSVICAIHHHIKPL